MKNVPDTKMGRMYREHIQLILDKNIEKLLDQYADDALLISSFMKTPKYYKGRDQLREHMQGILGIEGLETEIVFWAESDDLSPEQFAHDLYGVMLGHFHAHRLLRDPAAERRTRDAFERLLAGLRTGA